MSSFEGGDISQVSRAVLGSWNLVGQVLRASPRLAPRATLYLVEEAGGDAGSRFGEGEGALGRACSIVHVMHAMDRASESNRRDGGTLQVWSRSHPGFIDGDVTWDADCCFG
jgi:hypothetical protein